MTPLPVQFPSRLVKEDSSLGRLLRKGLDEPVAGPSEPTSWQRLRSPRSARRSGRRVLVLATSLAGVVGVCWWLSQTREGADLPVTAEPVPREPAPSRALPAAASSISPSDAKLDHKRGRPAPFHSAAPLPVDAAGPGESADTAACARLARGGEYQQAASCYAEIARGKSMSAELALYEKARLESRTLGDPSLALRTLEEHRRRFPAGVLSAEVGLTRIELLARLGRGREALDAAATALQGRLGQERKGDLHALRGDLLADQADCTSARREYEEARKAGVHPSRLIRGAERCPGTSSQPSDASTTGPDEP